MTLNPKALETATQAMIDAGDFYYSPDTTDVETAITAYLKATDSVIVPSEATIPIIVAMRKARNERQPPSWVYRAMIQAAEGK